MEREALTDLDQVADGVYVRPMVTISRAIDGYLGDLTRQGKQPRTIDTYRRTLDDFSDTLPADWDVAKIGPDEVRRFLDRYNRKSAAYRAQKDSVLRGFFKWLYVEETIKRSPMERMMPPKRQRPEDVEVVSVTTEEVKAMLNEARTTREKLTLGILAYLGPRRDALNTLRVKDYKDGLLRFYEKGGKPIWKPVPDELVETIEAAITEPRSLGWAGKKHLGYREVTDDDYLIPSDASQRRPGERDNRIIYETVREVAKRCGVRAHTHSLRAAFAVYYSEQGGDSDSLQTLLGHTSPETTKRHYLRRLDKAQQMEKVRGLSWK